MKKQQRTAEIVIVNEGRSTTLHVHEVSKNKFIDKNGWVVEIDSPK